MDEYFKPFKTRAASVLSAIKNPEVEACVLSSKQHASIESLSWQAMTSRLPVGIEKKKKKETVKSLYAK